MKVISVEPYITPGKYIVKTIEEGYFPGQPGAIEFTDTKIMTESELRELGIEPPKSESKNSSSSKEYEDEIEELEEYDEEPEEESEEEPEEEPEEKMREKETKEKAGSGKWLVWLGIGALVIGTGGLALWLLRGKK